MYAAREIVITPNQIDDTSLHQVGARAVSRVTLNSLGLPVPPFFVIPNTAFHHFLGASNGHSMWQSIIDNCRPFSPEDLETTTKALKKLILNHPFETAFADIIASAYSQTLGSKWCHLTISPTPTTITPITPVLPTIKGETVLLDFVRQVWAAQLTPHAISAHIGGMIKREFELTPIMVSAFEPADVSGTISTIDPESKDKNLLRIEAIWGSNPQNEFRIIGPDVYLAAKDTKEIIVRRIETQDTQTTIDRFGHSLILKIPASKQASGKLTDEHLAILLKAGIKVQDHTLRAQTINWLCVGKKIFFTRFTELATISQKVPQREQTQPGNTKRIATGLCGSPGITTAPLLHVTSNNQSLAGQIAVFETADIKQVKQARAASGIIIQAGGLSSELAQTARELGIPTLIGTGKLSLHNGTIITLDASRGQIVQNTSTPMPTPLSRQQASQLPTPNPTKTATKLYLTLSSLDPTQTSNYLEADGVGICKGSEILTQTKVHPKYLLSKNPQELKTWLMTNLLEISHQFGDRPLWYLPYDLDGASAENLLHASPYETSTGENPLLGFRGAYRLMYDSAILDLELDCLSELRHKKQAKNCNLLVPFLRNDTEWEWIKKKLATKNLFSSNTFSIKVEVATPSAASFIPKLATEGVSGIHINLDVLAALTLGYDLNNAELDDQIDVIHPAVIDILKQIVAAADHAKLPVTIASYLLDQKKDVTKSVIKAGVTALTISSHRFHQVKAWVQQIEVE